MADDIILPPNSKAMQLSQGKYAIVDNDDYEKLSNKKWYFHAGYAVCNISLKRCPCCKALPRKMIYMHKEVSNCPDNLDADHINRNKLDNRKSNLRICTRSQNCANAIRTKSKWHSKFKGVTFHKGTGRWLAVLTVNHKRINIGGFDNEKSAAIAWNEVAAKHLGEFATLNIID